MLLSESNLEGITIIERSFLKLVKYSNPFIVSRSSGAIILESLSIVLDDFLFEASEYFPRNDTKL